MTNDTTSEFQNPAFRDEMTDLIRAHAQTAIRQAILAELDAFLGKHDDGQSPDTHLKVPIIEGKRGKIPDDLPPILARLKIDPDHYVRFINRTQNSRFHGFIGSVKSMRGVAGDFGRSFLKGQAAAALFSPG